MWGANFSRMHQSIFHDAGFEHPFNQAKDTVVSYPLLQKLERPLVINSIEEAAYIGFDDEVNTVLLNGLP